VGIARTTTVRTVLVWILLELVAALQVRSASGSPVLFSWLRTVIEPVVIAAEVVADLGVDLGLGVRGLQGVIVDNRKMRIELEELRTREMLLRTDLEALRGIGEFIGPDAEFEAGSLVGRCAYRDLVAGTMEVRTAHPTALRRDTPVVSTDGLVGRVVRSEGQRHWLQLLTHAAAAVAVETEDSVVQGLALGTGGDVLTVAYVPRQAVLERGALLVTSGGDGIYPPGIPTVRVMRVRESDDPFLEVTALATANLRAARMVLLLPKWAPARHGGWQ
jgi:rod shape-determining protein MreC